MIQKIISADDIHSKIHTIRGVQVMLDSDLAEIYGYETKNFNRQVKNIEKFPADMMFQLTREETDYIMRCKNFTSSWGGPRFVPHVFTEQGIFEGILHRYVQESVYSENQGAEIAFQCLGNL